MLSVGLAGIFIWCGSLTLFIIIEIMKRACQAAATSQLPTSANPAR
jgi:hypothetical protein